MSGFFFFGEVKLPALGSGKAYAADKYEIDII